MNELAPFSFWLTLFGNQEGTNIREHLAKDWLIKSSHRKGFYNPEIIRGSGVWRDQGRIIVNNGNKIITHDGKSYSYQDFKTNYIYVLSEAKMGDLTGEISTPEEGRLLIDLFKAQLFSNKIGAFAALGWCLIAPFCSFLSWRPPIWIIGPGRAGKSYLIDNIMSPLVGSFCYNGSGRDSESAIRRSIGQNGQPAIIDETEPRTPDARKRLDSQIDLVRNGTSDASMKISLSNGSGGVDIFNIRSCFAFSSVIPHLDGNAIESRFTLCRLEGLGKEKFQKKKDETIRLFNEGVFRDPGRFRNRIFKFLPQIHENIQFLRNYIFKSVGDQRVGDNFAPFFASIYALQNEGPIDDDTEFLKNIIETIEESKENQDPDEDLLIREIFAIQIRDDMETFTVGQLIWRCFNRPSVKKYSTALQKNGIRVRIKENELAIVRNHRQLRLNLQNTSYFARYGEILIRHPFVAEKGKSVRMADTTDWCVTLKLDKLLDKYYEVEEDEEFDIAREPEENKNENDPFPENK